MAKRTADKTKRKTVETITHDEASRKNIPTAEFHSVMTKREQSPIRIAYERRNRDLDHSSFGEERTRRIGRI